jgi:hypothetical protein
VGVLTDESVREREGQRRVQLLVHDHHAAKAYQLNGFSEVNSPVDLMLLFLVNTLS